MSASIGTTLTHSLYELPLKFRLRYCQVSDGRLFLEVIGLAGFHNQSQQTLVQERYTRPPILYTLKLYTRRFCHQAG